MNIHSQKNNEKRFWNIQNVKSLLPSGNATNSNETELGENMSATQPLEDETSVKEQISEDKGNSTEEVKADDGNNNSNNNNNNNNDNSNETTSTPIKVSSNNKFSDPFQAMIASIGPHTESLTSIGNFSANTPENGDNGSGQNTESANNNNVNDEDAGNSNSNINDTVIHI